jgi:hypothetical protein
MDSNRRRALTAGVLFIAATVTNLLGAAIEQPVLNGSDYLSRVSGHANLVSAGGLLELIAAGTSAGIAVSMYPMLKRWSAGLALGSVVSRTVEAVMYTVAAVSLLSLPTVGKLLAKAAIVDRGAMQAIADSLLGVRQEAVLAGVFAFIAGALMYYSIFYQSRLIPRWLSGWGIVGVLLLLLAGLSALFSGSPVTTYTALILPIAVQEMVLAVWLIARGFSSSALQSGTGAALLEGGG